MGDLEGTDSARECRFGFTAPRRNIVRRRFAFCRLDVAQLILPDVFSNRSIVESTIPARPSALAADVDRAKTQYALTARRALVTVRCESIIQLIQTARALVALRERIKRFALAFILRFNRLLRFSLRSPPSLTHLRSSLPRSPATAPASSRKNKSSSERQLSRATTVCCFSFLFYLFSYFFFSFVSFAVDCVSGSSKDPKAKFARYLSYQATHFLNPCRCRTPRAGEKDKEEVEKDPRVCMCLITPARMASPLGPENKTDGVLSRSAIQLNPITLLANTRVPYRFATISAEGGPPPSDVFDFGSVRGPSLRDSGATLRRFELRGEPRVQPNPRDLSKRDTMSTGARGETERKRVSE